MSSRVLVIDHEPAILRAMQLALNANGYETVVAATGTHGIAKATASQLDLIVLDLGLPDLDGLDVIAQVRSFDQRTPIIILSAQQDLDTKVRALDLGADDFVEKPFNMPELLARVRVAVRRTARAADAPPESRVISTGSLVIDIDNRTVQARGSAVELTRTQFDVLVYFARHPHRVLTHRAITNSVWGSEHDVDPSNLRVVISNIRKRVEPDPDQHSLIRTVVGIGYSFEPRPELDQQMDRHN